MAASEEVLTAVEGGVVKPMLWAGAALPPIRRPEASLASIYQVCAAPCAHLLGRICHAVGRMDCIRTPSCRPRLDHAPAHGHTRL